MILFFAKYPSKKLLNDGMFRRIKAIDSLFEEEQRLYVYPEKNLGTDYRIPPIQQINAHVAYQALDFRYAAHNLYFAELVAKATVVYAHTIVHSAQYITPYLETGKVICDAHGIAAEEWQMSGYPSCSRFWNPLEQKLVRDSARVIVVTQAMKAFYREKYAVKHDRFIHIPILPDREEKALPLRHNNGPLQIIYAGGTHPWQNVDLMLDAAQNFQGEAEFIFLSGDQDTFQKKIAQRNIPHKITLRSVPAHEVDAWYARADFGFVLRDDDPVNNVAFPTKLIEYMQSGVIPIIKTNRLGDIVGYGLEVITLEQFLLGELPSHEQRMHMAEKNISIFSTVMEEYRQGAASLLRAVKNLADTQKAPVPSTQYPTSIQQTVFPLFFTCSYVADGVQHSRLLDCATYPLVVELEFQKPTTLSMLALDVSGRDFVLARPEARFTTVDGLFSGPCANFSDFSRTAFGDMLYRSGWIYFTCPNTPVSKVAVCFDIKLFETEVALLSAPSGGNGWMLKKAWRVLRQQGLAAFLKKVREKLCAGGNKRFVHCKSQSVALLKAHLPASVKSRLKALCNGVRQRRFLSENPPQTCTITPADVLFQVENFLAGGLENVVLDLLVTVREAGMSVGLLVLGQPGEAVKKAEQLGIPVCIAPYSDAAYGALLDKAKPRLLMTHYSILGLAQAARRKIPVIQVIHNSYIWLTKQEREDFHASAQHTDIFIAVSPWAAEYSVKRLGLPPEKVHVIENGIDLQKFQRPSLADEGKKLRKDYGFAKTDVIFLSVAAIAQQKNPLGLVRAFHAARATCPNAKLALLGPVYDPALRQDILDYCAKYSLQDTIFLLGATTNPAPYYAMADIFAHAAFFEGGQLCFLEVLAMNLPCVSTEVGFCRERGGQPGLYLCPPPVDLLVSDVAMTELRPTDKSVQDLAECMCAAYVQRARPSLGQAELEKLDRKVTYAAYVKEVLQLLKTTPSLEATR